MHRVIGTAALIAGMAVATASNAQAAAIDSVTNGLTSAAVSPLAAVAPAATASAIALNQWYTFAFAGTGSSFANGGNAQLGINPFSIAAPDPAWTFTLPGAGGTLIVADGFSSGDQFNVTDLGASLGDTSAPTFGGFCGNDITACLSNSAFSQGSFSLAAGAHAIDGTAIASPFGGGAAFFEVVSSTAPVPEPASLALLGSGLLGLGMMCWRRRT